MLSFNNNKRDNSHNIVYINDNKLCIIEEMTKEIDFEEEFYGEKPKPSACKSYEEIPRPAKYAIVIEQLCETAQNAKLPLCSLDGDTYLYNGAFWQQIERTTFDKFLSRVACKSGINPKMSITASAKRSLEQQFHAYASRTEQRDNDSCIKINLSNGILKIDDNGCTLMPFSADEFMRYQIPVAYDENAKTDLFQQFLDRVLPEKESQNFLAEYIGYALTNNLKLEQCLLLIGTGANGKSVVFDIVNALLGTENITHYTLSKLCDGDGYYRSMISGKLLNYSSELGTNLSDVDMVKKLISGEPVDARNPYGRPFTVYRYCKFMFNTNSLPTSVEISDAYFRRMNFMQFDVTIPKSEQDPELAKKIIATELDGVLQWVLTGLKRLLATRQFTKSPKMEAAKEQIRRDLDSVATFMVEYGYKSSSNQRVLMKELREEYNEFCKLNNCRQVGHKSFGQRLRAAGFDVVSGTGNRTYVCCETTQDSEFDVIEQVFKLKSPKQ